MGAEHRALEVGYEQMRERAERAERRLSEAIDAIREIHDRHAYTNMMYGRPLEQSGTIRICRRIIGAPEAA